MARRKAVLIASRDAPDDDFGEFVANTSPEEEAVLENGHVANG